jgi:GT2 family glycosyltransferase
MIYFLTVNYYSTNLVRELIDSIKINIQTSYQFFVVNNSPGDQSIYNCNCQSSNVIIINSPENIGFGSGCNLGIQYIYNLDKKALIWIINPDTTLDREADNYILGCFEQNPSIAILGTKIRDDTGKIWFSRGIFNPWLGYLKHEQKQSNSNSSDIGVTPSRWVCGCSLIINLSQFDHCPKFDSQYFLYGEDVDFCERYYQKGYFIAITNNILVTHQVSSIIGKDKIFMHYHYTLGCLLLFKKNATQLGFFLYLCNILLVKIPMSLILNPPGAVGRWRGIKHFFQKSF